MISGVNLPLILGIDIGARGALALLTPDGELVDIADMPTLDDGVKSRMAVNAPLLADLVRRWAPGSAFVEFVAARPTDSRVGAFAFGRARGAIEGVLGSAGVPVRFITPQVWKRTIGIPPGKDGAKDAARSEAIRRWPAQASLFARKLDDGRAEAALIAVAGIIRHSAKEAA